MADSISALFGGARLSTYDNVYPEHPELVLRLYTWNSALSGALWGPLGILEVATRNAVHRQLSLRVQRADWWEDAHLTGVLIDRERRALNEAIGTASRRKENPSADDVVAASGFGLWVGLLSAGVPRDPVRSYETSLWQPRLHRAFPHYRGGRKQLHAEFDVIRNLRNRVAHHEPVFKTDLARMVDAIARVAGYIDRHAEAYIRANERVSGIVAAKREFVADGRTFI